MPNVHMQTATTALVNIKYQVEEINERLGRTYLILSRALDEQARTKALDEINAAMSDVRILTERISVIDLSVSGIDSDVQAGMLAFAKAIYGERVTDDDVAKEPHRE